MISSGLNLFDGLEKALEAKDQAQYMGVLVVSSQIITALLIRDFLASSAITLAASDFIEDVNRHLDP